MELKTATLKWSERTMMGGYRMELELNEPLEISGGFYKLSRIIVILTPVKNLESGYIDFKIPDDAGMEVWIANQYDGGHTFLFRRFFTTDNVNEAIKLLMQSFLNEYILDDSKDENHRGMPW